MHVLVVLPSLSQPTVTDSWRRAALLKAPGLKRASALLHSMHAERQRPAAYMHADYTRFIGWSMSRCPSTSPTQRHVSPLRGAVYSAREALRLLAPPARKSSGFGPSQPPCARYGAHGRPARRTQPHHYHIVRWCAPAAPLLYDGAHPLHPVRVASGGLWMARRAVT
jgi:hypothetical protein